GPEASVFTAANFPVGSCVWLTFDRGCLDPYDRTLAYLYTGAGDQDFYQRRLLLEGYASVMIYSPNDAFEDTFRADQAQAQADGVGMWTACAGR
ncbi:MAG: hypothetical protein GXP62_15845, partial [Oligoflexia bacterium]|nr:hypothetical protein [Oligoflexia bacterium]